MAENERLPDGDAADAGGAQSHLLSDLLRPVADLQHVRLELLQAHLLEVRKQLVGQHLLEESREHAR